MSIPDPEVMALRRLATAGRIRMNEVVKEAGIAHSTWCRWCAGMSPNVARLRAVREAIERRVKT